MTAIINYIKDSLKDFYSGEEVKSFIRIIMKHVCSLEPHQLLIDKDRKLPEAQRLQIETIVAQLQIYEPIQYILGVTTFYGRNYNVTPATLIPRPETEELVEYICCNEKEGGLHVLDIGTGSGCIAISLAALLRDAKLFAMDISKEALNVAKENALNNEVQITFMEMDILSQPDFATPLDIIVSNPPYVLNDEKSGMERNVLDYEPHTALFVPDNDPLLFYREIAVFGQKHLTSNGRLYFEINAALGQATVDLLKEYNYRNVVLKKDIFGKDRMIKAEK
jgi:protein-(glutamine-N5) methyltransferase, release factor-specific